MNEEVCTCPRKTYEKRPGDIKLYPIDGEGEPLKDWDSLRKGDSLKIRGKIYHVKGHDIIEETQKDRIPAIFISLLFPKTESDEDVISVFMDRFDPTIPITITYLSTYTGLSRNTIYRICKRLIFHCFIKRNEDLSYSLYDVSEHWHVWKANGEGMLYTCEHTTP